MRELIRIKSNGRMLMKMWNATETRVRVQGLWSGQTSKHLSSTLGTLVRAERKLVCSANRTGYT